MEQEQGPESNMELLGCEKDRHVLCRHHEAAPHGRLRRVWIFPRVGTYIDMGLPNAGRQEPNAMYRSEELHLGF